MSRRRVLIITNLFADPFGPGRATFNQQQFSRLGEHMDVSILVPVSWIPVIKQPLAYWRLRRETRARWPQADYVIYWYLPGVGRSLHAAWLLMSLLLQRLPTLLWGRWDCLLGSWAFPDAVATTVIGKLTGTPVVIKVHGSDINVFTQDAGRRWQIRWALDQARAVVSVSRALIARMREIGVRNPNISVLYNGVDPTRFHPQDPLAARARLGLPADEQMILFVGNILVTKGCGELMDAFCELAPTRPQLTLAFVGDGPMAKALAAQAQARGLADRVRFPGRMPHQQLNSWYAACTVFCLPSYAEGVPNVVLEAMACGKPVVSTDVGGVGEILPAHAGRIVPSRDAAALAVALEATLAQPWDAAAIVAHTASFDWALNVAQLRDILDKAAAR